MAKKHQKRDVVIIGAGMAGLTAALSGHRRRRTDFRRADTSGKIRGRRGRVRFDYECESFRAAENHRDGKRRL